MGLKGTFRRAAHGLSASSLAHLVDGPLAPIPFSLHPDYDRRPRDHTGSADLGYPQPSRVDLPSARGLCALRAITAGGELHPALRTLPPAFLAADILYHNFFANAWLLFANSYQIFCCVISAILGKPLNMTNPSCSTLVRKGIHRLASRADHLLPRPLP